MNQPKAIGNDRRRSPRFPIECELEYRTLSLRSQIEGKGKVLNISGSGVLFSAEHDIPPATKLEVSISWPVRLNGTVPLRLVAKGLVARSSNRQIGFQFGEHQFRLDRPSAKA